MRLVTLLLFVAAVAFANAAFLLDPHIGGSDIGQSVADALRDFAGSEIAFVPADLVDKPVKNNELSTSLAYPNENFVVLELTGLQIRQALERSLLLFPSPNVGFLQISGLDVSFNKDGVPNSRVTSVLVNGSKLEDSRKYQVAMPISLQSGQLGYSNIWDNEKVAKDFAKVTIHTVLQGKHVAPSASRWSPQP